MKRMKIIGLALLAVFALSVVAASAAQALQAPYFAVESKTLTGTTEITATQLSAGGYVLSVGAATKVTCKTSGVLPGAEILNTNEVGTSKETIQFGKCTIANNGTCTIRNETITTNPLKNELVYDATSKESKSVAVEFTPEAGPVLSKITLVGEGCTPVAAGVVAVEGQIVAQAFGGASPASLFLLELGVAPVLAVSAAIKFPPSKIKTILLIENGVGKLVNTTFTFAGKAATLEGETELKLSSGQKWCIIS